MAISNSDCDSWPAVTDTSKLELVHSRPRHKLYRGRIEEGPVVLKTTVAEAPAAHAIASMRHEFRIAAGGSGKERG